MKKIIEFNLPEDKEDFEIYNQAMDMYCSIHDIEQKLRDIRKYRDLTKQQRVLFEEIDEFVRSTLIDLKRDY
jgi:hypothetical protein